MLALSLYRPEATDVRRSASGKSYRNQKKSKPLNLNGLAVFVFRAYPKFSLEVIVVVGDSGRQKSILKDAPKFRITARFSNQYNY